MEVNVNYITAMKFEAVCGKHRVSVDLPVESNGTDTGPTPPQYFLTSLASCVGVYVASYCNSAKLNAKGMQIKITADKMQNPSRIDNIKILVALPNAEVGKRRDAVLSVARKCLIHNTLHDVPQISIDLAEGQE
ncbi:MAG: OsmC family protein [PVC group bacterium]|nr:OsmC family protein [PVC group bacterium]